MHCNTKPKKMEKGGEAKGNKRSIIKPRGGKLVHTGKFRLPDGTIKVVPEMGMKNVKNMEKGGAVPAKFKGFSKLPEEVQMKMNPQAAKKYKRGGCVMSGRGGSFKGTR